MRKALVVGIDHYEHIDPLAGCVNDAFAVKAMLERHADGSVNFGARLMVGTGPQDILERAKLKEAVRELFDGNIEVALFYFAGHGFIESTGGYLCAGDCKTGDDGLALSDVMTLANGSKARNKIIILDSCYSGALGDHPISSQVSEISEGMTILTASTKGQYAAEANGGGVFTGLLVDALGGAAANLTGQVTPGGVYAHIDQSLGIWSQRPVFKTNVETFVSLRQVKPPLALADLRRISEFFPEAGFEFHLDPAYEPTHPNADPDKNAVFAILQRYNRVNLLIPINAPHMWHAALDKKTVKLTALGEHYRRLAAKGLIYTRFTS
jgi:Caspase domain